MADREIRAAVFDIDGTLAMMDKSAGTYTALPGAVAALAACRERGVVPLAYTNGTFFPPAEYYPLLADAGLAFAPGHILTPATVAARALVAAGHRRVMVLAGPGTRIPVEAAGIELIEPGAGGAVDAVLLGYTRAFGAAELEAAAEAIWAGAALAATSVAPYFASSKGRMLGISGALAAALEHTTGVAPQVFGKPSTAGLDMVAALSGATPEQMAVIGDDPRLEITMARRAGAYAIGVTTGVSDADVFAAMKPENRAHEVLTGLEPLLDMSWLREDA